MSSPIDVILCFHNAFRKDIAQIDTSVLNITRSGGNLSPVLDRLHSMNEILDYHARGEEAAVFPAVDNVAPLVARAYLMDHRELDKMVESLEDMRLQKSPRPTPSDQSYSGSKFAPSYSFKQRRRSSLPDSKRKNNTQPTGYDWRNYVEQDST